MRRRCDRGFNPLPSPKQGEMAAERSQDRRPRRFNPLPSPKQGEMTLSGIFDAKFGVSIRSPRRSKGRFLSAWSGCPRSTVSIRSPRRSKGRWTWGRNGDCYPKRFNPLPSPKQGEIPTAVTGGAPIGYAGGCAMRPNDCHEFPIRLSTNAITRYRAVTCRLREYAAKTPLLGFRACYKISGASKFTGSSIP